MSVVSWRIVKKKYEGIAFDGRGASLFGGRWNSPGRRVVYTASSKSLALLELLVHLSSTLMPSYVIFPVKFSAELMSEVDKSALPAIWKDYPAPVALRDLGDKWLESLGSTVLKVPSAIVPDELNYLINPAHPDFLLTESIEIGDPVPFELTCAC